MRRNHTLATLMLMLMGSASCGKDSSQPDRSNPADSRAVDARSVDARSVDSQQPDRKVAPHLATTHSGWAKPLCLSCHNGTKAKAPHSGYRNPECVSCHGYNGARHKSHATTFSTCNNSGCHESQHETYVQVPADCIACHNHPDNPAGT
jgi:hypothetical protein